MKVLYNLAVSQKPCLTLPSCIAVAPLSINSREVKMNTDRSKPNKNALYENIQTSFSQKSKPGSYDGEWSSESGTSLEYCLAIKTGMHAVTGRNLSDSPVNSLCGNGGPNCPGAPSTTQIALSNDKIIQIENDVVTLNCDLSRKEAEAGDPVSSRPT